MSESTGFFNLAGVGQPGPAGRVQPDREDLQQPRREGDRGLHLRPLRLSTRSAAARAAAAGAAARRAAGAAVGARPRAPRCTGHDGRVVRPDDQLHGGADRGGRPAAPRRGRRRPRVRAGSATLRPVADDGPADRRPARSPTVPTAKPSARSRSAASPARPSSGGVEHVDGDPAGATVERACRGRAGAPGRAARRLPRRAPAAVAPRSPAAAGSAGSAAAGPRRSPRRRASRVAWRRRAARGLVGCRRHVAAPRATGSAARCTALPEQRAEACPERPQVAQGGVGVDGERVRRRGAGTG